MTIKNILLRKGKIKMNDKRKKFVKYANLRLDNAIKHIQCLGNLQNLRQYEYSQDDVKTIEEFLLKSVNETIDRLKNPKLNFNKEKINITKRIN